MATDVKNKNNQAQCGKCKCMHDCRACNCAPVAPSDKCKKCVSGPGNMQRPNGNGGKR